MLPPPPRPTLFPYTTLFRSKRRENKIRPVHNPQTIATAIRIGSPVNWPKVLKAIKESKGTAETVTDSEILEAQDRKSTRLNSSHRCISYAVFCLKKKIHTKQ